MGHGSNVTLGDGAAVLGGGQDGFSNLTTGDFSVVAGGQGNQIIGSDPLESRFATIGGGSGNSARGSSITISGGFLNVARKSASTIAGGSNNTANGARTTVGGGVLNQATGQGSTISGGQENVASGQGAVISGGGSAQLFDGLGNTVAGAFSAVGGGQGNSASAAHSAISGGQSNLASGRSSVVSGGVLNISSGIESSIGGGARNLASGVGSTVAGGFLNRANKDFASVLGGDSNTASGHGSTVAGGVGNCAGGELSWAGGFMARVRPGTQSGTSSGGCFDVPVSGTTGDRGTFIWADGTGSYFTSTGTDQFLVRAAGGMGVGTNAPETQLHVLGPSPNSDPFGQLRLEGSETTGAAGTGAGLSLLGHDGNIRRIWGYIEAVKENSTVGSSRSRMSFYTRGASGLPVERFRINSNGTTFNTTGAWSTLSDGRLKSDIGEIPDALDRLTRLRGVSFRYTDPKRAMGADGPRMGFLAEEVEQVFPEWVGYNEDGYRFLTLTGFEAVVVEALRSLQQRSAEAIEQRDLQIAGLQAGLTRVETENLELRQALGKLEENSAQWVKQAARNAELETRLANLEEMLLVGRRLAGSE